MTGGPGGEVGCADCHFFLGSRRLTEMSAAEKSSFRMSARINDHGEVKGSNTPGKVLQTGYSDRLLAGKGGFFYMF